MNRIKIFLILLAIISGVLSSSLPAQAGSWRIENGDFQLAKDEVIEGDLFFGGGRLKIDGTIRGDLVLFAEEAVINGTVDGSILGAASGKLRNDGIVGGSVRGFVNEAYLGGNGIIKGSISLWAFKLITKQGSIIEKGILGRFSEVDLMGKVLGDVSIHSSLGTKLGGEIGGDLQVRGAPIKWVPPLTVAGKVMDATGYGINPAKLDGVQLQNGYLQQKPVKDEVPLLRGFAIFSIIWFLGTLLTSLILYRLFPRTAWQVTEPSAANFRRSLLMGLIGLAGLPILVVILTITVVGFPLALLLGIFYIVLLLFSGIPLNLWLGRLLFKSRLNPVLMTVLGSLCLAMLSFSPILGLLIHPFLFVLGMGMIIGNIKFQVNQRLDTKLNA